MCMALQGEMYGLHNVFTSVKGPGKDLLEALLSKCGATSGQFGISFEEFPVPVSFDDSSVR